MSLQVAVAVPFRQAGTDRLGEGAFVVALSLDREWFSPDQAKRLVDVAVGRGLLETVDGDLVATFDLDAVDIPAEYTPDTDILRAQSTFEQLLDRLTDAGMAKQEAVAAANETQRRLGITLEAAAVLVATREGIAVDAAADAVRTDLSGQSA
ncbi:DUF2240 family protein [Halonotius pteroides]|jgi:hypothetical protein|uniref:DUF2240 domain-containing protein n=1 Tax=Halonotius pteroides TaxID=268735 RepID=A0A3A6Q9H9_9EURY|nr:DUF2240 family protein [Halonotius pteroides]RJX51074.1 DUF2240 domain-containing protein [Halonotius pteroides]